MRQFPSLITRMMRRKGQDGQTLVEYSLILALIALVGLLGVTAMAGSVDYLYETVGRAEEALRRFL